MIIGIEHIGLTFIIRQVFGIVFTTIMNMKYPRFFHQHVWVEVPPEMEQEFVSVFKKFHNAEIYCLPPRTVYKGGKKFDFQPVVCRGVITLGRWFDFKSNNARTYLRTVRDVVENDGLLVLDSGVY